MTVLTPEAARKILDDMAAEPTAGCAMCPAVFSDDIPPVKASFGPFPVWLCGTCKERHENFRSGAD
jgi:hypothetical protein